LTINGTLATGGVAYFNKLRRVYVTSAGNDSGVTFTIVGLGVSTSGPGSIGAGLTGLGNPTFLTGSYYGITEVLTGANASKVCSSNLFWSVSSVTINGAAAGAVTVGMQGLASLDVARQVIVTSGGADTGITFTITGTDWAGLPATEALTGASGGAATSVLSYKTVSSILTSGAIATTATSGTNGIADSQWVSFDPFAGMGPTSIQINGSGTVNWSVYQTLDSPNDINSSVTPANMTWVAHPDSNLVASAVTSGVQGNYGYPPVWAKLRLNSGTGSATAKFVQVFMGG
jgi:hypothetical protein